MSLWGIGIDGEYSYNKIIGLIVIDLIDNEIVCDICLIFKIRIKCKYVFMLFFL